MPEVTNATTETRAKTPPTMSAAEKAPAAMTIDNAYTAASAGGNQARITQAKNLLPTWLRA